MWLIISISLIAAWLFYKYYVSIYNTHWQKRGIPSYPSKFPYGSDSNLITFRKFQGYVFDKLCYEMEPNPLFGVFVMRSPMLVTRDIELISFVLTKEFSHFRDRTIFQFGENDVLQHHLFNLEGEKWRALRVKLTPTFTSGKLKAMFPLFINCAEAFNTLLMTKVDTEVDIKDLTGRLTTDIICSCAFGLETNVINDPDHKLRKIGLDIFKLDIMTLLRIVAIQTAPKLFKFLGGRFTPIEVETYLVNLVKNTIEFREKNNVKRNDFLDLLMQLKNKGYVGEDMKEEIEENTCQPFELTTELMAAQCFVFFAAGFETSSSVQSYCLYELAVNQDMQNRLREEIERCVDKNGGLTYQAIKEMEYLEMVVSETLRKYPTLTNLIRRCTKTLTTSMGYTIESGDTIFIPIWTIQHDPNFFPNPEKFDPERFSKENIDSIKPYSYLPFGEGPRMCIGKRFGLVQTKVGIITVLRKFKVEPCAATKIPLEFVGSTGLTNTKDPIKLKLTKLKLNSLK